MSIPRRVHGPHASLTAGACLLMAAGGKAGEMTRQRLFNYASLNEHLLALSLTRALREYADPEIVLLPGAFVVGPRINHSVTTHTMDATWHKFPKR